MSGNGFDQHAELKKLEQSLQLTEGFFANLANEDDWSFVIKGYALLEAALTEFIIQKIARVELHKLIRTMNMDGRHGKLLFAQALGELDNDTVNFIRAFGALRNAFAHRVANVGKSLETYFTELGAEFNEKHAALDLVFGKGTDVEVNGTKVKALDLFRANGKLILRTSLGMVLVRLHVQTETAIWSAANRAAGEQLLNDLVRAEFLRRADERRAPEAPDATQSTT